MHPKDHKSGNVLVVALYLTFAIWSVVHMSAFILGMHPAPLISWPDMEGTITLHRTNRPELFFPPFRQCFPGGCHSGATASGGRIPAAS